jgi:hypothetical protein
MELANESRCLDEGTAAGERSGTAMVREGIAGLADTWEGWGLLKAEEGKKEEAECESDLYIGTGDEMCGRDEDASSGLGGEMRGRESSNFRS